MGRPKTGRRSFLAGVGWTLECHSSALPTGQARAIHPLCCLWKVSHLKFRLCGSPFSDEPGSRENGRHSRPALQDNLPQRMAWIWIEGAVAQVRGRRGPARVTVTPLTWSPLRSRLQAMWGDPRVCGGDAQVSEIEHQRFGLSPRAEVMRPLPPQGSAL